MYADTSLTGQSVIDAKSETVLSLELPNAIAVVHGSELASKTLNALCYLSGVKLDFIQLVKRSAYRLVESFEGGLCDERLNLNVVATHEQAQEALLKR